MHAFARWLLSIALLGTAAIGAPASIAAAQQAQAPFCVPGQAPSFAFAIGDLHSVLGAIMGDPVECEHPNSANGDTLQQTTTGLAVYRQDSNTPEFTDGWNHWALTDQGVVAWAGSDRPVGTAQAGQTGPPAGAGAAQCVDVGAGLCLNAVPELADTVALLSKTSTAPPLLRTAARGGYLIHYGDLAPDVLGVFRPSRREVIVSASLRSYPMVDRGPILVHELQHVSDWIDKGGELDTTSGCLATEENAFQSEAATWLELHAGHLEAPANDVEQEFNAIARAIQTDPAGFTNRLTAAYQDECAGAG